MMLVYKLTKIRLKNLILSEIYISTWLSLQNRLSMFLKKKERQSILSINKIIITHLNNL